MRGVKIYRRVRGRKVEELIAHADQVQGKLDMVAHARAQRARAVMAEHHYRGFAKITVERVANLKYGLTDRFVILDDEADLKAALTIEYGRKGKGSEQKGRMAPIAPIRTAFPEIGG